MIAGYLQQLSQWWASVTTVELVWLSIGFFGQTMFMMRFIVQWIASERVKRSIVPEAFWYFSLAGGLIVLAYATYRLDPVFMLGQAPGIFIYSRNIQLIRNGKRSDQAGHPPGAPTA